MMIFIKKVVHLLWLERVDILKIVCIFIFCYLVLSTCAAIVEIRARVQEAEDSLRKFRGMDIENFYNPGRKIPISDNQEYWSYFKDVVNMKHAFDCKDGVDCYGRMETNIF